MKIGGCKSPVGSNPTFSAKRSLVAKKWNYFKQNWKFTIHILLGTYKFGVNNQWWSSFPSLFGIPFYKRTPRRIWKNYEGARFRAVVCHFVSAETAEMLFPNYIARIKKGLKRKNYEHSKIQGV